MRYIVHCVEGRLICTVCMYVCRLARWTWRWEALPCPCRLSTASTRFPFWSSFPSWTDMYIHTYVHNTTLHTYYIHTHLSIHTYIHTYIHTVYIQYTVYIHTYISYCIYYIHTYIVVSNILYLLFSWVRSTLTWRRLDIRWVCCRGLG